MRSNVMRGLAWAFLAVVAAGPARAGTVSVSASAGTEEIPNADVRFGSSLGSGGVRAVYNGGDPSFTSEGSASVRSRTTGFSLHVEARAVDNHAEEAGSVVAAAGASIADRLLVTPRLFDLGSITTLFTLMTFRVDGVIRTTGDRSEGVLFYGFGGARGGLTESTSYGFAVTDRSATTFLEDDGVYEFNLNARMSTSVRTDPDGGTVESSFGSSAVLVDLRFVDQDGREVAADVTSELGLNYDFAVPEPGTLGMGMVGLGIVALAARKRWVGAAKRRRSTLLPRHP